MALSLDDTASTRAIDTEQWTMKAGGREYNDYDDENISQIDDIKTVNLNPKQFNITQEKNSQYIPFEMPRFYDGFDLLVTNIMIYYVNADGYSDLDSAVNIHYNDEKIRFAWLVNSKATAVAGNLKFEIQAHGINSKGEGYVWKTRPNSQLNVLESLEGNGNIVETDPSWISGFMTQVKEQVAEAQKYAGQAEGYVTTAEASVKKAEAAASQAQGVIDNAKSELEITISETVANKMATALDPYYTKGQVDQLIANIDISDQLQDVKDQIANLDGLANFNVTYDGTNMIFYNGDAVMATIPIQSDPSETWVDNYTTTVVDAKVSALKTEVANNYATTAKLNEVSSTATSNKANVDALSAKVTEFEEVVSSIDTSPRLTYDATYDDEFTYTLWEIENEGNVDTEVRNPKAQFKIQGGGGGGGTSSSLKIEYITTSPIVATLEDNVVIKYRFSGTDSSGDDVPEGTATWRVGGRVVATNIAINGENTFDVTEYLTVGTQKVNLSITDEAGSLVTKTWTVQKIDVRLESSFNDKLTYPLGNITFDFTPYGAIDKVIHFKLDGTEIHTINTASSGVPMSYAIPAQVHGAHLLEVYMTATINGNAIESNHILKDIIWYDSTSTKPVIGCAQFSFTAKQYDATNIQYTVYDPSTETPTVTLAVDGVAVSTLKLDGNTQVWQYKGLEAGTHTLTITCGETVKTIIAVIEKIDIDIEPVTAGLVFDFNPSGKSNNDADRLWSNGEVAMSVSDNFDWTNGGYHIDENGDQYFCVKAGTYATINYNLFADDAKRNGKEFKLVFKTENISKANATFLKCVDGSDNAKIGVQMNVHEAYVYAGAGNLYLPYSEEDIIEFEFNINKSVDDIPMVMGYEDGVSTRPMVYSDTHDFTQVAPQDILIGSPDCDILVYRFKVYNTSLTDRGILNNFIADARNAEEMIARYTRNQIYDENQQLTPEILAEKCPWLRIIKLDAPHFTNDKKDKVTGTTIQYIYKDGDSVLDNWTAYNVQHSGQGTTSNEYGAAGRNLDLIMNKSGIDGVSPKIVLSDGTETSKVALTRDSVPVNYFNVKVNIASSENANNALLQRRYNEYNPYIRPAKKNDPRVKDSMEFVNCVLFIRESDPDIATHREFQDTDWHFYAIGNVGDSKKTDKTRLDNADDPLECIVEIMDNTLPNSTFSGTPEALAALDADVFDEEGTYGWRYIYDEDDPTVVQNCMDKWKEFYRFVATSTDEEFKANLKDYFVVDTALFAYLFTTRYTMIDNRSKNTFWHYSKCEDGVYRWDLCFDYDNDSALGINNSGELTMTYGYEDTDYKTKNDPSTGYAFNAADSKFFCRIRDLFKAELQAMYVQCESKGAWSAEGLIKQFDDFQAQFPEELWRIDTERKYLRTFRDGNTRFLNQMANGKKKYQRRQFERNQEMYMATKFFGTAATSNQIMFRCNTPKDAAVAPDYTLHLTPYSDMYLSVMFGATYRTQVRAEAGKQYDIKCPFNTMDDTAVLVYGCSHIQSMGDISACYIHDNDFSKATRLKELIIGNTTAGYQNNFLTNLGIGNNKMLEKLDIQNTPNLAQALDLSKCGNLTELYAYGSGLTGVTFANGGNIKIAQLQNVNSLSMKNLAYLTGLDIVELSNMTTLIAENCSTVDIKSVINEAANLNRVRITGVDWTLDDTAMLERIRTMSGVDNNGYNIPVAVLAGKVAVPVIKQQQLYDYQQVWPDLEIVFNTLVEQYKVKFVNYDGIVLDVQYVDKGGNAVDPITRADNPIEVPTKPSSVSTDFTFDKWDSPLVAVFADRVITATYSEFTRRYTIKYVSKGITLQESAGLYGENILYTGSTPTYTLEEGAWTYYLFNRWDNSGFINGDKTVNAIFDSFTYTPTAFAGKKLSDLTPVQIYALTKIGDDAVAVMGLQDGDDYSFELGYDIDYDDIESQVLISEKKRFDGTNYLDTGIKLFDVDKDFVVAIDYEFLDGNVANNVLAQCYQTNGGNGFRLFYNSGVRFSWGTSSVNATTANNREMVIIRHKKGDYNLTVYNSKLNTEEPEMVELTKTRDSITDSTLVFGCSKADDGAYERYAIGDVYWAKVWYEDLGDDVCKKLAGWTHEKVNLEVAGKKRYYLADNPTKRCTFSMLATHLLDRPRKYNETNTNIGGWANSALNRFLNTRLYNAIPTQIQQLVKNVTIASSIGQGSADVSTSACHVYVPAVIEMSNESQYNISPYIDEGTETITYMINDETRKRAYSDGVINSYWLRSPNVQYKDYIFTVSETGSLYGFNNAYNENGVLIGVSF